MVRGHEHSCCHLHSNGVNEIHTNKIATGYKMPFLHSNPPTHFVILLCHLAITKPSNAAQTEEIPVPSLLIQFAYLLP